MFCNRKCTIHTIESSNNRCSYDEITEYNKKW